MSILEKSLLEPVYSKEIIQQQLQTIIRDPLFATCKILRNFLVYVVQETLQERANRLKEYTIALNVLHKPADFNTKESGIVRIHAGRLRRTLNHYYRDRGRFDKIRISIPKGSYVATFTENEEATNEPVMIPGKMSVIGVVPFRYSSDGSSSPSLSDGLGIQLSAILMQLENISVIAYYTMRNMIVKNEDIEQIGLKMGAHLLITGDIQIVSGRLRLYIQMIQTNSNRLAWSRMYERKLSADNFFDVQDELVMNIFSELGSLAF